MRLRVLRFAVAAILLAVPAVVQAAFPYNDFSNTADLQLNGNAAQAGNVLRLTTSNPFQSGSAFTTNEIALGNLNSFSTHFRFQITANAGIGDEDGVGADGLVFVIQTQNNTAGGAGGGIGYQGITPSIGIEFDTYNNGIAVDPNGNHVGLDLNGSIASTTAATESTRFNNGQIWNAWIDYNGATDALEVRWSMGARPLAAQLAAIVDLELVLNHNTAFLGFTAGTGSGYANHDILSWEYRDSFAPIDDVPEPASLVVWSVLALIGGCVAYRRTRRAA